ncbi:MAG: F0F1 ATP synthase subunit epsilon [Alphaproteobacteria bacterium]|nr:F0F1 ATP synthase subunit epsilon [Alphaproteobacteria bacterium]
MAETAVQFELVSPERLLLSEEVEMVVVPGGEGDFGVLPGHSPLISTVRPGVIHVFADGSVSSRIFVAGGFAEVTTSRCTVLAEEALAVDDIDRAEVESDLRIAVEDLGAADDPVEQKAAENRASTARAKLAALDAPAYQ